MWQQRQRLLCYLMMMGRDRGRPADRPHDRRDGRRDLCAAKRAKKSGSNLPFDGMKSTIIGWPELRAGRKIKSDESPRFPASFSIFLDTLIVAKKSLSLMITPRALF